MPNENVNLPIDARVEITIEQDRRSAYMVIHAPQNGGEFVTPEQVRNEINASNITFGLEDIGRIQEAVKTVGYGRRISIASWRPPVDGENGFIEYHFSPNKVAKPTEDEHGNVDYKDLGLITNILRGTKIATIHEPTEGQEGYDVLGNPVPQKIGKAAAVRLGTGTALSSDGQTIVAAVDGNLVFKNGSFVVDEELKILGDVGFSTGNIDFIGNVTIGGNVFEGFKVNSKKNVTIRGTVTSAQIYADGNVDIKLGCLQSTVKCKGNFKADFCETCNITAGGDVEASSFVGCDIYSDSKIIAKGKSTISGGKYTAINGIEASTIGSDRYIRTEITVGNNAILTTERAAAVTRLDKLNAASEQLTKAIDMISAKQKQGIPLKPKHEQLKSDSVRARILTQNEIKKLTTRIGEIDEELSHKQNISVVCQKRFYPGTILNIDAFSYTVKEIHEHSKATVLNDNIVILPA